SPSPCKLAPRRAVSLSTGFCRKYGFRRFHDTPGIALPQCISAPVEVFEDLDPDVAATAGGVLELRGGEGLGLALAAQSLCDRRHFGDHGGKEESIRGDLRQLPHARQRLAQRTHFGDRLADVLGHLAR